MTDNHFAVEMQAITKSFGESLKANDSVDFKVRKGEIHALVGENGAGKSTLMKILYGMYHPDTGTILLNGKEEVIESPSKAISLGIGMVHQHFMLVDTLSVLENIILGDETANAFGLIDYKLCTERINKLTLSFNISIDLKAKVETLSVGIRQKIEILKILYRNADILILDEPTAVLTPQETDELFITLKELKSNGKTIILITHKLGEVLSISDSVTILRQGKIAGEVETSKIDKNELAKLIVGEEFEYVQSKTDNVSEKIILSVKGLTVLNDAGAESVKNVSFDIRAGEILGIAGVEGNGQTELIEAVNGLREYNSGIITVNGKVINKNYQIAHIPADRHRHGIVMEYSIAENIILSRECEEKFSTPLLLKQSKINKFTNKQITDFDIRPQNSQQIISGLSGGNQQKTVAARELTKDTHVITACHPTRGLDIKATNFVHISLLNESEKGKAILVVSSDLSELLQLCNRIAVMYNGEITAMLDAKQTGEREIGLYMTGFKGN
jgi:general nucleoside transport system ATP-binding protein